MKNQALGLYTRLFSAIAWESPEILTLTPEILDAWYTEEPGLENYRHFLNDTLRQKAHTLSAGEEELLSLSADMSYGPQTIFNMFNNADLRFPSIDDGNGHSIEVTHGRFITLMESRNRQVRKDAFDALYHTYGAYKNTLAAAYSANVKKELFYTGHENMLPPWKPIWIVITFQSPYILSSSIQSTVSCRPCTVTWHSEKNSWAWMNCICMTFIHRSLNIIHRKFLLKKPKTLSLKALLRWAMTI